MKIEAGRIIIGGRKDVRRIFRKGESPRRAESRATEIKLLATAYKGNLCLRCVREMAFRDHLASSLSFGFVCS